MIHALCYEQEVRGRSLLTAIERRIALTFKITQERVELVDVALVHLADGLIRATGTHAACPTTARLVLVLGRLVDLSFVLGFDA